jgi:HK97 family phage prohead protease
MDHPDAEIVRALARPITFRAPETDDSIGVMEGYSTVFGSWYEIDSIFEGQFLERVAPGAAAKTIRESGDQVKVLFNHGRDVTIGNKVLGVHSDLREDDIGVRYQVPLFDTSYNRDLLPGLRAGAYGSSFMFRVTRDEWVDEPDASESNPKGIPERTIKEFRLFEHGPVTFPANPAATSGARSVLSLTDEWLPYLRTSPDLEADGAKGRNDAAPETPSTPREHLEIPNRSAYLTLVQEGIIR